MVVAFSITWLFVSTRPDEETTMPVPAAAPPWARVVSMSTKAGSTCDAIAAVLSPAGELFDPDPDPVPVPVPAPRPDPDPTPEEPWDGMVPNDGELPVAVFSMACSTPAPTTPEAAMTATATMAMMPQLPRGFRLGAGA